MGEKYVQERFLGEESRGEKYIGEKYVQEEFLGEESLGEQYVGEKYVQEKMQKNAEKNAKKLEVFLDFPFFCFF